MSVGHRIATKRSRHFGLISICALWCAASVSFAAPSILLHTADHEAPVRGDPDDLLFIPGVGFHSTDRVVYQAVEASTDAETHPGEVPPQSSAQSGTAPIVQIGDPALSITVRLPAQMQPDTIYRLWVVNRAGEWSDAVSINDPRPMWITPSYAYSAADNANLGRRIRVVGRNLAGTPARPITIRLRGPNEYRMQGIPSESTSTLDRYIAEARLPERMAPGNYFVSVSRDARTWTEVSRQQLQVRPDPAELPRFELGNADFGGCRPDDGIDDGVCLTRAIEAARQRGGGIVMVPKGHWDLTSESAATKATGNGFVLPPNVHLRGSGAQSSFIVRHGALDAPHPGALLTVSGNNSIAGLAFTDENRYASPREARPVIQLGAPADTTTEGEIADIVISDNVFRRVGRAIVDSGKPVARLFVTGNDFGAYADALLLIGNRSNVAAPFRIVDSVIRANTFAPGSYADLTARQGAIASQLGASYHVDFSANIADGTRSDALQDPDDPHGWRAGFFWSENGEDEMILVADNQINCPGDKAGDGEALAFDGNANTFAFESARVVTAAGPDWISAAGLLVAQQNGHRIDSAKYYLGHWIQVVAGPGIGQTRKIESYSESTSGAVRFRVTPKWDVVPTAGSARFTVGRHYWQVYVLANRIDQRSPPCRKANLSGPRGGLISLWAPSADFVIEGNRQLDSDGIVIHEAYDAKVPSCPTCGGGISFQTGLEVRNNVIEGEYDWQSDCSTSGIMESFGAAPTPESPPPILGFGVSISHNVISHADGLWGGAIDITPTWFRGPPPQTWALVQNSLIFHNIIRNMTGSTPRNVCHYPQSARTGLRLEGTGNVRDTVLYGNSCEHVDAFLQDSGRRTARICSFVKSAGTCECAAH